MKRFHQHQTDPKRNNVPSLNGKQRGITRSKNLQKKKIITRKGKYIVIAVDHPLKI